MDGLKECFEENKDKEKREKFTCSFECFFKHHNVLDDNGEPSKEKLLAKVEGFEGEWKQTSIKIIEDCFAKQEEMKAKHGGGEKKEGCHPASAFMNMCLGKNFLQNCPAAQWNDCELLALHKKNNELSKEKALEYAASIEEGEWREKTKEIVESCWARLDAMKELSAQKPSKCPLLYMMMQICLSKKVFVECPAAEWHTTPFCEEAKQSNCLQD
ncbi:hypothetical protein pipiens_016600 [Culex pipiens pipiens]|uniref:Odorant-binding protein n=1 Tax=Culex pipiens pipiens TaxID=38569 RepID=A0ABD1CKK2_CULPP